MEVVCQQCGDRGFENAYVYCVNCLNLAIHRYCLPKIPETLDEFVSWLCVDCDPELVSWSHLKNNDSCPCNVSQRSSDEQAIPDSVKRPQSTLHSPALEIHLEKTTEKGRSRAVRAQCPPKKKLKKNGMTCTEADTGEQRHHTSDSCRSQINVDLTEYALKHDSSVNVSKKIKDVRVAETVDEGRESSNLHGKPKNLDSADCANLEIDLSSLINSKENCIASTIAGTKEQTSQIICLLQPSELPTEHASNVGGSSPVCENLDVRDNGIDLRDKRLISEERSKLGAEAVTTEVPNSLEALDGSTTVFNQNYYLPAQPIIDKIWRGSFSISYKNYGLGDAVVGHLSNKACPKVCEEAGLLPTSLCLEMLPKLTVWPKSFQISEPNDENIGLYFFPRRKRFRKSFDYLIEDMMDRELAMRAVVKNAELLVFTSCELPLQYWKFQGNYFLWGVFRAKQTSSSPVEDHHLVVQNSKTESFSPLSSPNDVGTDSECSSSAKKTKILNARSPLSPLSNTYSSGRSHRARMNAEAAATRGAQLEQQVIAVGQMVQNGVNVNNQNQEPEWAKKIANMKPDFFYGKEDPTLLENWIRDFEKVLDAVNCPVEHIVNGAVSYFKEDADNWWTTTKDIFLTQANFNWDALKIALRARFYPADVKEQKYIEFVALKQGNGSVTDYYKKFMELSCFAGDSVPTDERKVTYFIAGLNFGIQKLMLTTDFTTVHEAYEKAANIWRVHELQHQHMGMRKAENPGDSSNNRSRKSKQGANKRFRPNSHVGNQGQVRPNFGNEKIQIGGANRQYNCRRCNKNHPGTDCAGNLVTCYNCRRRGHRAFECQGRTPNVQPFRNGRGNNQRSNQNSFRNNQHGNNFWPNNQNEAQFRGNNYENAAMRPQGNNFNGNANYGNGGAQNWNAGSNGNGTAENGGNATPSNNSRNGGQIFVMNNAQASMRPMW